MGGFVRCGILNQEAILSPADAFLLLEVGRPDMMMTRFLSTAT
jgi:hypothetical protein